MKMIKAFLLMFLLILTSAFVSAQNVDVKYVEINGNEFDTSVVGNHSDNLRVERGEDLDIKVALKALADVENVQVEADIYGYKYSHYEGNMVSSTSKTMDLAEGDNEYVELDISIPWKMDKKYTLLRIRVGDEDGQSFEQVYQLHIVGIADEDAVVIRDFSFSPSSSILAGRAFTTTVRVQNIGDDDLDDVKVTVELPELNVRDTEYLDELEADEKETLEEFLLRIPDCAEPGDYQVEITAEFGEYQSTKQTAIMTVLPGDACPVESGAAEDKVVITVPEEQAVDAGTEISYPVMIKNEGRTAKTFTVTVSGVDSWGTSRMSPSSVVVVPAGQTESIFLYVKPKENAEGEKVFTTTIASDGESETIPLTANVAAAEKGAEGLEYGLKVALIVLVIILIIIGLVIGFTKLRDGGDESSQTYY